MRHGEKSKRGGERDPSLRLFFFFFFLLFCVLFFPVAVGRVLLRHETWRVVLPGFAHTSSLHTSSAWGRFSHHVGWVEATRMGCLNGCANFTARPLQKVVDKKINAKKSMYVAVFAWFAGLMVGKSGTDSNNHSSVCLFGFFPTLFWGTSMSLLLGPGSRGKCYDLGFTWVYHSFVPFVFTLGTLF